MIGCWCVPFEIVAAAALNFLRTLVVWEAGSSSRLYRFGVDDECIISMWLWAHQNSVSVCFRLRNVGERIQ